MRSLPAVSLNVSTSTFNFTAAMRPSGLTVIWGMRNIPVNVVLLVIHASPKPSNPLATLLKATGMSILPSRRTMKKPNSVALS